MLRIIDKPCMPGDMTHDTLHMKGAQLGGRSACTCLYEQPGRPPRHVRTPARKISPRSQVIQRTKRRIGIKGLNDKRSQELI